MIRLASTDELLDKAFQLACFILNDRDAALSVVRGALAKLEVATAAQGKRLYYKPIGRIWSSRSKSDRFRNNIFFNEPHLLQRLIYLEAEPYEIAQEQAKGSAALSEEDLVIHFIKHLTKKTIKRNSFYVTLGLSRLLYSYTTAETMDIYNAVIQDPERVKDDYYYRSRKGILMQELKQRFGDLINICRGPRGEERFQPNDSQSQFIELVRDCLTFFTPWHTSCSVPAGIDPITDGISSLSYQGRDKEDKVELNRLHAVLHPDCFQRLTTDLGFDTPDTRLEIPRFFYANDMNANGSNGNRRNPSKLSEQELLSIRGGLDHNAARRKTVHERVLRLIVDGIEQARIDLSDSSNTRVRLDKDAELVEILACDNTGDELLLASHLLTPTEIESGVQPVDASIILEGGQEIVIHMSPDRNDTNRIVEISYRETNLFRAASLLLDQVSRSLRNAFSRSVVKNRWIYVSLIGGVLLSIAFGLIFKYARTGNPGVIAENQEVSKRNKAVKPGETLPIQPASNTGDASSVTKKNTPASSNPSPQQTMKTGQQPPVSAPSRDTQNSARVSAQQNRSETRTPESGVESEANTRGVAALPPSLSLTAVRKVYVEIKGDETLTKNLREMLTNRLRASNRISSTSNRDEADGLLKVIVTKGVGTELTKANVELINARGDVIWPNSRSQGKYNGSPADMGANIVRDLLLAIERSKKGR